jgi:hypothetical protein
LRARLLLRLIARNCGILPSTSIAASDSAPRRAAMKSNLFF